MTDIKEHTVSNFTSLETELTTVHRVRLRDIRRELVQTKGRRQNEKGPISGQTFKNVFSFLRITVQKVSW